MTLLEFLVALRRLLDRIVSQPQDLEIPPRTSSLLEEAWREVQPLYDELEDALSSGDYEEELYRHGLTGAQLRIKLEPFQRALHLLDQAQDREPPGRRARGVLRRMRRWIWRAVPARAREPLFWFRKVLEKADIVLGSLADIVPGGGAVTEFKEVVESLLGDVDDGSADAMARAE